MEKTYRIIGMTCSNCALLIEKSVKRLSGVNQVTVSLMQKTMAVDFQEEKGLEDSIILAVKNAGYGISEVDFTKERKNLKDNFNPEAESLKRRFLLSLIIILPLLYLSMNKMFGLPGPNLLVSGVLQSVFALVVIIINRKFYISGVKAVKNKMPNMDTLVSLGSFSAYLYSIIMLLMLIINGTVSHFFFESSAMVLALVTLGKWLEELTRARSSNAVKKLLNLLPNTVTILKEDKVSVIDRNDLQSGDLMLVRAGEYISADGVVVEGNGTVDKSALTGESLGEEIGIGMQALSGELLVSGYVTVRVDKVGADTLFSGVINSVIKAGSTKAPMQRFADKIASIFVPVVTTLALITFIIWISITGRAYTAFNYGISVLVISCPCAIGLATPVAITAAVAKGAQIGILYKNASAVEKCSDIKYCCLDKTATLTEGKPTVTNDIVFKSTSKEKVFALALVLEEKSTHPLAKCLVNYCSLKLEEIYQENPEEEISEISITEFENVLGKGIKAEINGKTVYLGSKGLIGEELASLFESRLESQENPAIDKEGKTLIYLCYDKTPLAVFYIQDNIKKESYQAIKSLKEQGITPILITGDNEFTARAVAKNLGIETYHHSVMPSEKQALVENYKKDGALVAMVGDGINDSPALKSADFSIAMGTGTEIAIDVADAVLITENVKSVSLGFKLGRFAKRIIKGNLFWALIYNMLALPLAGGVLAVIGITLTPMIASGCMCASSLFVTLNALRITAFRERKKGKTEKLSFKVEGMHCKHCVEKVKKALGQLSVVKKIAISLKSGELKVKLEKNENNEKQIISLITEQGFKVSRKV